MVRGAGLGGAEEGRRRGWPEQLHRLEGEREAPRWEATAVRLRKGAQAGLTSSLPLPHQVTCYHKGGRGTDRTLVFRVQFHTCTIHSPRLTFPKEQLDEAWAGESRAGRLGG